MMYEENTKLLSGRKYGQICKELYHCQHRLSRVIIDTRCLHVGEPVPYVTEIRTFASEYARMGLNDDLRGWLSCSAEVLWKAAEVPKDGGIAVLGS